MFVGKISSTPQYGAVTDGAVTTRSASTSEIASRSDCLSTKDPMRSAPSAIVVGAGIAGLTAARDLKHAGWQVTVLEARDRLGGRLFTHPEGGLATELGGEFIDSQRLHPQVHDLAKNLSVPLVTSHMHRQVFEVNGRRVKIEDIRQQMPEAARDYDAFWAAADTLAEQVNVTDVLKTPFAEQLDRLSVAQWMDTLNLDPRIRPLLDRELALEYGTPEQTSLLHFALHTKLYADADKSEEEMYRIEGGTQALIHALARDIEDNAHIESSARCKIQTNAAVESVTWHKSGVSLSYQNHTVSADFLVLATPLPPLREVPFNPPLPEAAREAIFGLTYSDHQKVVIYDSPTATSDAVAHSRPDHDCPDYVQTQGPLGGVWQAPVAGNPAQQAKTTDADSSTNVQAYISYNLAQESVPLSTESSRCRQQFAQAISQVTGKPIVQPSKLIQQHWHLEAFSGGSFSNYGPEEVMAYWSVLRAPCGPIVFAGEHAAAQFTGYIEGAVESGHRAAAQLISMAQMPSTDANTDIKAA